MLSSRRPVWAGSFCFLTTLLVQPTRAEVVVLRDSVGNATSASDGTSAFAGYLGAGSGAWFSPFTTLTPAADTRLTRFVGVGTRLSQNLDFGRVDWRVNVWSSQAALLANPLVGDLLSRNFAAPTLGPLPWGTSGPQPPFGVRMTYRLEFDLSPAELVLPADEARYLGVIATGVTGSTTTGFWGWSESREAGSSDALLRSVAPTEIVFVANDPASDFSGRLAWRIEGDTTPTLLGDMNGDCQVGAADYAIWAAQFGQTGSGLAGDVDGNGTVGAADYALWAANFGKSCPPGGVAVPEPTTSALATTAIVFLFALRRGRRPQRSPLALVARG